jgi:hypothetical protein
MENVQEGTQIYYRVQTGRKKASRYTTKYMYNAQEDKEIYYRFMDNVHKGKQIYYGVHGQCARVKQIYYRVHRYAQSKKQQRCKCRKKERTKAVLEQQQSLTGMITIISELLDVC